METSEEFNRLMEEEARKDVFLETLNEGEKELFQSAMDKYRDDTHASWSKAETELLARYTKFKYYRDGVN